MTDHHHHRPAAATDQQLARLVGFLARTCLEIERGLRSPDQLLGLMDPTGAARWRRGERLGWFPGGPVQPGDLRPPHLCRLSDRDVLATVTTRTHHGRWAALTLQLRSHRGRWRLADLQRLRPAAHYQTTPTPNDPAQPSAQERLARAIQERRLVAAAWQATSRRLAELPPGHPSHPATTRLLDTWRRLADELEHELALLRAPDGRHQHHRHPPRR